MMPNIKRKCIGGGLNKTTGVFSVSRKGRVGNFPLQKEKELHGLDNNTDFSLVGSKLAPTDAFDLSDFNFNKVDQMMANIANRVDVHL